MIRILFCGLGLLLMPAVVLADPGPTTSYGFAMQGKALSAKGDYKGAISADTAAIELDPHNVVAHMNRGNARLATGDLAGALKDYSKAITLDPNHAKAFLNRGSVYQTEKNYPAALADYNSALALDPNLAAAVYNRATVKRAMGDVSGASADYSQAIALNSKDVQAYMNRAVLAMARKDWASASADLQKTLSLMPGKQQIYARLFMWAIAVNQKDSNAATAELRANVEKGSEYAGAWAWTVGEFVTGKIGEDIFLSASSDFQKKSNHSQVTRAYYYIGMKHLAAGNAGEARKFFKKCAASGDVSWHEVFLARAELSGGVK